MSISLIKEFKLPYLATPYTNFPDGIESAFEQAAELAGDLLKRGRRVYAPIVEAHSTAIHGGLNPIDNEIWTPFCEPMVKICDALLVGKLETWDSSRGIFHEIQAFKRDRKPIFYIDPITLQVER